MGVSLWADIVSWLANNQLDPITYVVVFFAYCVAAAVALPLPVELLLAGDPVVPFPVKALVMGLGKGVGALAVFYIGVTVEKSVMRYAHWGWFKWLLDHSERLVRRYGYYAMFGIMAIPGMVDTIPLYIFSILNKEGKLMDWRWFVIVNILAGITRAVLIYVIDVTFGLGLFT